MQQLQQKLKKKTTTWPATLSFSLCRRCRRCVDKLNTPAEQPLQTHHSRQTRQLRPGSSKQHAVAALLCCLLRNISKSEPTIAWSHDTPLAAINEATPCVRARCKTNGWRSMELPTLNASKKEKKKHSYNTAAANWNKTSAGVHTTRNYYWNNNKNKNKRFLIVCHAFVDSPPMNH